MEVRFLSHLSKKCDILIKVEILLHDLPQREVFLKLLNAHIGKISGLCFADEERLLSCGVDRNVKLWDVRKSIGGESGPILELSETVRKQNVSSGTPLMIVCSQREPLSVYPGKNAFK